MKLVVRILVSTVIIATLLWFLPIEDVKNGLSKLPLIVWLQTIALFIALHVLSAFKWRYILVRVGQSTSALLAVRAHFYGLFSNMFLPTIVGGDVVRAAIVAKNSSTITPVISSGIIDRLIDTAALVTIIVIAAVFVEVLPENIPYQVIAGLLLAVVVAFVLFGSSLVRLLRSSNNKLMGKLADFLSFVVSNPAVICLAFVAALCIQGGFIVLNIQLAYYIGIGNDIAIWFFCWPLAKLVGMLPVSFGGIGVRDAALVGLLATYQIEPGAAFSQSLAWQATLIVSGLLAALVAWLIGLRQR